ncbi:MAG: hypothetical protein SOW25_06695 [Helicobacter sp.]|nr:hypothetical protein [Helicobacteraceae bacterium]MDY3113998.1 hypothetical protein [Helicobacter sp.]
MHGKIVRYLNSNGRGVVINSSKMLFEFNKDAWHDKKIIPMVGMYVEFRANEAHQITDCKVSKFQEFGGKTLITESQFWHHDTDEELLTLQSNARDAIVQKIYKSTDYTKITNIQLDLSVMDSIKNYFHQEFLAISFLNDLPIAKNIELYDYNFLKRFSAKALDHLLYNDKTIAKDDFVEEISVLTRLESALSDFEKFNNLNIKHIFESAFLVHQCHYQALVAAIANANDSKALAQKRVNALKSDISLYERRIAANLDVSNNNAKLEKAKAEYKKMVEADKYYGQLFDYLDTLGKRFFDHYFKQFSDNFTKIHTRIKKKVKSGVDICMAILDDKIYHKAIKSMAFSKNFFKNPQNDRVPNIVYFMEQYLEHLNKEHLNEKDVLLYRYSIKLRKSLRKNYLIVSTDEKKATDIKLEILGENKFSVVKTAYKNTLYFSLVSEFVFDRIYIDPLHIWKTPAELIAEAKSLKVNADSAFTLLESTAAKENRFGFLE